MPTPPTSAKPEPGLLSPAPSAAPPDSPTSSAVRKGKGGRKAANPHLTDEQRRRERVLKNRESAMKSLQKKKRYTEDLEHRALLLSRRNAELKAKIRALFARLNNQGPAQQHHHHIPLPDINPVAAAAAAAATAAAAAAQIAPLPLPLPLLDHALAPHPSHPQPPQFGPVPARPLDPAPPSSTTVHTSAPPPNFSPIDDWVPALSDPFMSAPGPAALDPQTSQSLPAFAASSAPDHTSHPEDDDDVGDSFMGLGINAPLPMASSSAVITSAAIALQPSIPDPQFSLTASNDVAGDKISPPSFDVQHMACSQ